MDYAEFQFCVVSLIYLYLRETSLINLKKPKYDKLQVLIVC